MPQRRQRDKCFRAPLHPLCSTEEILGELTVIIAANAAARRQGTVSLTAR